MLKQHGMDFQDDPHNELNIHKEEKVKPSLFNQNDCPAKNGIYLDSMVFNRFITDMKVNHIKIRLVMRRYTISRDAARSPG